MVVIVMNRRNNYYNCFIMSITSLLKMREVNTEYLFKNMNLEIVKNNSKLFISTNNNVIKEMYIDHNIEIQQIKYTEDGIEKKIIERVLNGEPCSIVVDIYYLSYCIYHMKTHEVHSVVIFPNGNEICILDGYYGYNSNIEIKELENIINHSNKSLTNGVSFFFAINLEKIKYDMDFKKVLLSNIDNMNRTSSDDNKFYGLQSIDEMKKHFQILDNNETDENFIDYIETLYLSIKDIAMYREGFSQFVNIYGYSDFANLLAKVAKEWLVLANLTLMCVARQSYSNYKERILRKIEAVIELENNIDKASKEIINNY